MVATSCLRCDTVHLNFPKALEVLQKSAVVTQQQSSYLGAKWEKHQHHGKEHELPTHISHSESFIVLKLG